MCVWLLQWGALLLPSTKSVWMKQQILEIGIDYRERHWKGITIYNDTGVI